MVNKKQVENEEKAKKALNEEKVNLIRPINANQNKFTIHYSEISGLQKSVQTDRAKSGKNFKNTADSLIQN